MPGARTSSLPTGAHVVALLLDGPVTQYGARDMLREAGIRSFNSHGSNTVARWLDALHEAKAAHICRWVQAPRGLPKSWTPVYAIGPGQDAPKPEL